MISIASRYYQQLAEIFNDSYGAFRISGDLGPTTPQKAPGIQSARMRSWGDSVRSRGTQQHVCRAIGRLESPAAAYYQSLRKFRAEKERTSADSEIPVACHHSITCS